MPKRTGPTPPCGCTTYVAATLEGLPGCRRAQPGRVAGSARPLRHASVLHAFVTHGTRDAVLPIDRCSRRLVPVLRTGGLDVAYEEFDGGHSVPRDLARRAVGWMVEA